MTHYKRFTSATGLYYFQVGLCDPTSDLLVRQVQHLRNCIRLTRQCLPFDLVEAVVLPDQMHMIWRLQGRDQDYAARWRMIKGIFVDHLPQRCVLSEMQEAAGENGLWQRQIWEHCIRDEADLNAHRDYMWRSPVTAGLVARPTDWQHSSIHRSMAQGALRNGWKKPRLAIEARAVAKAG